MGSKLTGENVLEHRSKIVRMQISEDFINLIFILPSGNNISIHLHISDTKIP